MIRMRISAPILLQGSPEGTPREQPLTGTHKNTDPVPRTTQRSTALLCNGQAFARTKEMKSGST